LYILDQYLQPVPVGVVGELYIGGMGVSRGYLYRPEVTAENNIPNPFAKYFQGDVAENDFSGDRLYKSGDLARYLPDGNIECLGRVDFQVKIRGFRVELGEIEAFLGNHSDVSEATAWVWGSGANKRLVAYVVPQVLDTFNEETQNYYIHELREYLRERVPDYMLPSAIVLLDALPLTPNGKLDRNALPIPDMDRSGIESEYVAPRSPQEEILVSIWANVLGVDLENGQEQIGIFDNFFDVGGHSLLATQVISRVQDAFDVNIPLRTIFETPTIAGLAERIDQARLEELGIATEPIRSLSRDEHTHVPIEHPPLSFAQQRLWFIEQLEPNNSLYNTPAVVRLSGTLNVAILERSINSVIQRHEALRTTFTMENERPVQVIDPESEQTINVHDISSDPDVNKEDLALEIASRIVMTPFDLVSGPLVRFDLICMAAQEYIAVLNMHHIITDAWSLGVFIQEIGLFYDYYQSADDEETIVTDLLPPLSIQYADFASWQREWLQGEILDQQLTYWREQLKGVPPLLELPIDQPRPAYQTYSGGQVTFDMTDKLSEGLYALSRELGATLFMVLLAAFQTLLFRYTGSSDISVGTPIANRTRADIENLIGFFVNTLVMRTYLSGEQSFRELVDRVREVALGAYSNQDVPFEMLVNELAPDRDMSYSPLFQVMLVLQNAPQQSTEISTDLTLSPVEVHDRIARFDLTMSFVEMDGRISGSIEYNTDLFRFQTIERMAGNFQNLLSNLVAAPDQSIATVQMIGDGELKKLLVDWVDTSQELSINPVAHKLFEQQESLTPDAIALYFNGKELTYSELNSRSNQLAHYLIKLGVKPEAVIGICTERSIEMIVAIIGVLKAGCAYLPIDPAYPDERIEYMIKDSGASTILTQEHLLVRIDELGERGKVLVLETGNLDIYHQRRNNLNLTVYPKNLSYVIYTSGSTGRPKGTLLHHEGLVNFIISQIKELQISSGSKMLQFAGFSFDASVAEIFMPLLSGATLYLASRVTDMDLQKPLSVQRFMRSRIPKKKV
jgi:non-ribosomal peptide synthetase component F/acyl carrier protein